MYMTTHGASSWKGKRCLVTGGVGFLGSHLCRALHDEGAEVVVLDREPAHAGTLFPLLNSGRDIRVIQCDLALADSVRRVVELRPDCLFHLAGLPYAPYTTRNPREAEQCNVQTTANMLEAARLVRTARARIPQFVFASSACVFGAAQHSPLEVDSPVAPPEHYYTVTKQEAENRVHAAYRAHGVRAAICRFGNIYGPGDRHVGRIVPQVCHQLIGERRDVLQLRRSDGESVFEFLHVDDAVTGLLHAAGRPAPAVDTWQFSGGAPNRLSVLEIAQLMSRLFDGRHRDVRVNQQSPERRVRKYLETAPTRKALAWEAKHNLDDGLRATLAWYQEHFRDLSPHAGEVDAEANLMITAGGPRSL
jgi:nucleoside-diphosphate-sugar epimerase